MHTARIQNSLRALDLSWQKLAFLVAFGMLIGVALVFTIRLPVS